MTVRNAMAGPARSGYAGMRSALATSVFLGAGVLSWEAVHWTTYQVLNGHQARHEHGLVHPSASSSGALTADLHGSLLATALGASAVVVVALVALRLLSRNAVPRASRLLWMRQPLWAAGISSAVFALFEIAEHAAATESAPPAGVLVVGMLLHALGGAGSALLSRWALDAAVRPAASAGPFLPSAFRLVAAPRTSDPVCSAAGLRALRGRAPPSWMAQPASAA